MKIYGLIILHYGEQYLASAIESIYDACEKIIILYTPVPSFGYRTDIPCPENAEDLMTAAFSVDKKQKIQWIEKLFNSQGEQRDYGFHYCKEKGADFIIVADADEVYEPDLIMDAIIFSEINKASLKVRMRHFFRSFDYICQDEQRQCRIWNMAYPNSWLTWDEKVFINHFGYAQKKEIIEYKWRIHGDTSEKRKDIDWFRDRFLAFPDIKTDLHPTTVKWDAKHFDKIELPAFMHTHPFFNRKLI